MSTTGNAGPAVSARHHDARVGAGRNEVRRWRVDYLVALAWAQSKCGSALTARTDTPRVHYDDYMRVSADYDERLARDGLSAACARAERIARKVSAN